MLLILLATVARCLPVIAAKSSRVSALFSASKARISLSVAFTVAFTVVFTVALTVASSVAPYGRAECLSLSSWCLALSSMRNHQAAKVGLNNRHLSAQLLTGIGDYVIAPAPNFQPYQSGRRQWRYWGYAAGRGVWKRVCPQALSPLASRRCCRCTSGLDSH